MCGRCEGHLGEFERVAAPVIKALVPRLKDAGAGAHVTARGPYRELKLFSLAALWRAGIASGPNWQAVELGSDERLLREMLLHGIPGSITSFPCVAVAPHDLERLLMIIAPPRAHDLSGIPVFHFMFYGIHWFYFRSAEMQSLASDPFFATYHGATVTVSNRSEVHDLKTIADLLFP